MAYSLEFRESGNTAGFKPVERLSGEAIAEDWWFRAFRNELDVKREIISALFPRRLQLSFRAVGEFCPRAEPSGSLSQYLDRFLIQIAADRGTSHRTTKCHGTAVFTFL